jgi:hypothetical protein
MTGPAAARGVASAADHAEWQDRAGASCTLYILKLTGNVQQEHE